MLTKVFFRALRLWACPSIVVFDTTTSVRFLRRSTPTLQVREYDRRLTKRQHINRNNNQNTIVGKRLLLTFRARTTTADMHMYIHRVTMIRRRSRRRERNNEETRIKRGSLGDHSTTDEISSVDVWMEDRPRSKKETSPTTEKGAHFILAKTCPRYLHFVIQNNEFLFYFFSTFCDFHPASESPSVQTQVRPIIQ